MNDLVDLLNGKIEDAVKRAGPQVVFVKWEDEVAQAKGRYCESGVDETPKKGDNRDSLSFYNWYSNLVDIATGQDLLKTRQDSNQQADSMGSYQAGIASSIQNNLTKNPQLMDKVRAANSELKNKDVATVASVYSDKIMRCFHPQRFTHQIIAESVLEALDLEQAKERVCLLPQPQQLAVLLPPASQATPEFMALVIETSLRETESRSQSAMQIHRSTGSAGATRENMSVQATALRSPDPTAANRALLFCERPSGETENVRSSKTRWIWVSTNVKPIFGGR